MNAEVQVKGAPGRFVLRGRCKTTGLVVGGAVRLDVPLQGLFPPLISVRERERERVVGGLVA